MSNQYSYMEMFQTGVKVLGTVISVPRFGVAIGDVGYRALASPGGVLPSWKGTQRYPSIHCMKSTSYYGPRAQCRCLSVPSSYFTAASRICW